MKPNEKIKYLRELRGYPTEQIAKFLDMEDRVYCATENGGETLMVSDLEKLCNLYGITLVDFEHNHFESRVPQLTPEEIKNANVSLDAFLPQLADINRIFLNSLVMEEIEREYKLERVNKHCFGVASYMRKHAKQNKDYMFTLGLLHDVGKLNEDVPHEEYGALLMRELGFKYWKEIKYHGTPNCEYQSYELDLLNSADLSVNQYGEEVGYKARIEDIGERYGFDSINYKNAVALSKELIKKGFLNG